LSDEFLSPLGALSSIIQTLIAFFAASASR
jgi:hypothetical protein